MDIRQEQKLRIQILLGNTRLKLLEHIQFREISFGLVQVVEILSTPAKSFSLCALDAAGVDAALLQHGFIFRSKVLAYNRHHAHSGEVAGGQRKVSRCAAKNVSHPPRGRGDRIKRNRTYDENAHEAPEISG